MKQKRKAAQSVEKYFQQFGYYLIKHPRKSGYFVSNNYEKLFGVYWDWNTVKWKMVKLGEIEQSRKLSAKKK